MSYADIKIIDPNESKIPELALVQKVLSDGDKLPEDQHGRAVKAFLLSDGIASGIGKDLAFIDQIPGLIKEIIDNKLWECLYVSKGVVTPYYCRYTKGTDSENFRAFIAAKRPNGLETSVETIDRVLQADPEVQRKFRAIIYQAIEQERDELGRYKSSPIGSDFLSDEITDRQQRSIRAANRAAEVVPVIGMLMDRGLIAIDVGLGVLLLDFLNGDCVAASLDEARIVSQLQRPKIEISPKSNCNLDQLRQKLETIKDSDEYPPPCMEEVAKRLGYNTRFLRRHFLDLCRAISERYINYRKTVRNHRIEQLSKDVQHAALEIYAEGQEPTRSRVAKRLAKPAYFREKEVEAALSEIRHQLGLKQ